MCKIIEILIRGCEIHTKAKLLHWNSTNTSKKVVWQCKTYIMDGKDACGAKAVDESVLIDAFVRMFNRIYENRQSIIRK